MKTEAWTLLSISLPRRGEGDSVTIRNSWEISQSPTCSLKGDWNNSIWLIQKPHYRAVDREESRPGALVSTEKVALMSKRKFSDWSPTVINTWSSSGVIRIGVCVGTPSVPVVLRVQLLGPTPQRAVSSPVWSFADWTRSQGQFRGLRTILL